MFRELFFNDLGEVLQEDLEERLKKGVEENALHICEFGKSFRGKFAEKLTKKFAGSFGDFCQRVWRKSKKCKRQISRTGQGKLGNFGIYAWKFRSMFADKFREKWTGSFGSFIGKYGEMFAEEVRGKRLGNLRETFSGKCGEKGCKNVFHA